MGAYDCDCIENILSARRDRDCAEKEDRKPSKHVGFIHGALADPYEKQAREQGFTLGDKAELMDKLGFGLNICHVHGVLTDAEYNKALQRLNKKIVSNLKPFSWRSCWRETKNE